MISNIIRKLQGAQENALFHLNLHTVGNITFINYAIRVSLLLLHYLGI